MAGVVLRRYRYVVVRRLSETAMRSPRGTEKQRMGLRPVFSTHVAPRPYRCEHGAPVQGVGLVDFLETMFRLAVFRCEGVGGFVQVFELCGAGQ